MHYVFLKSRHMFLAVPFLCMVSCAGRMPATKAAPEDTGPPPVTVIDALKRNVVSLEVTGDDDQVVLTLERTGRRNDALSLAIPAGTTRLGFVTARAIAESGQQIVTRFSSGSRQLTFRQWVGTNSLDGEGFGLTLSREMTIEMPIDKRTVTVVAEGALNMGVPPGLAGLCLGGQHGHIVEGTIHVSQNPVYAVMPEHARYQISYGNMSIDEKGTAPSTGPGVAAPPSVAQAASSMPLMDAIRQHLVAFDVTGGKATATVTLRRTTAERADMIITLPAGTTKLGFTSGGRIIQAGQACTVKEHALSLSERVETNAFDSDGFALVLPAATVILIPVDKGEATVVVDGALSVDVPSGFQGFALAGQRGRVVDGTIHVGKNVVQGKEKAEYEITFSNMTVE